MRLFTLSNITKTLFKGFNIKSHASQDTAIAGFFMNQVGEIFCKSATYLSHLNI